MVGCFSVSYTQKDISHCYRHTPCGVCQASPDTESGREFFPWDLKSVCSEYLFCKVGRTQPPFNSHHLMQTQGCPLSAGTRDQGGEWPSAPSTGRLDRMNSLRPGGLPRGLCSCVTSLLALTKVYLLSHPWLSEKPHGDIKLCAAFATAFE